VGLVDTAVKLLDGLRNLAKVEDALDVRRVDLEILGRLRVMDYALSVAERKQCLEDTRCEVVGRFDKSVAPLLAERAV